MRHVALHRHSLSVDSADWRTVDTYAEFLHKSGPTRGEEARVFLERSLEVLPRKRVKGMLARAKTHVMLGDVAGACDMYFHWWSLHSEDRDVPLLVNNAAICLLREPGGEARERAVRMMGEAAERATAKGHIKRIGSNLELLVEWKEGGFQGSYGGSILW